MTKAPKITIDTKNMSYALLRSVSLTRYILSVQPSIVMIVKMFMIESRMLSKP